MIEIRENIEKDSGHFLPGLLVKTLNSIAQNSMSEETFLETVIDSNFFDLRILEYINSSRISRFASLKEAVNELGAVYCSFVLMNIIIYDISGTHGNEESGKLFEMQLFSASASYIIAKHARIDCPQLAYAGGLLSNISYFYLSTRFESEFKDLVNKDRNLIKRMNYEWETFGIDHAEISSLILTAAGFPQEIVAPVTHHHQKNFQEHIGSGPITDLSLAVYFGSMMTVMFYEDFNSASDLRREIKNFMNISSFQLESAFEEIIELFKNASFSLGLHALTFPGHFKLISWFDTQLSVLRTELEMCEKKIAELNFQNTKFQKVFEENNKKLVGLALKDPLTGAYNRRYLDEKIHDEFLKAKRYGQSFTVISADIDHFKKINDSYGHAFGDVVLIKLVQIIKSSIRKTDFIARTGGEEFIIVCHSSNELGGIIIAEKMRKIIESSSFRFEGKDVPVTMSFGVANFFAEVKSAEELIRISDERLYAAKNAGRNKVIYK
jgi:two-component system, cell cycle response regulator